MVTGDRVGAAHVLLIEDDRDIANLFMRGLRHYGHEVELAMDGVTGLQLALATKADLVLLDLRLPRLAGLEVLRRLRARRPGLRVAVLSNQSDPVVAEEARQLGACGYLVKSQVTPVMVAAAIRRWVAADA